MTLQLAAAPSTATLVRTLGFSPPNGVHKDMMKDHRDGYFLHFHAHRLNRFAPRPDQDEAAALRSVADDCSYLAQSWDPRTEIQNLRTETLDPATAKKLLHGAPKALWAHGEAHRPHWETLGAGARALAEVVDLLAASPERYAPVRGRYLSKTWDGDIDNPNRGQFFSRAFTLTPKVTGDTLAKIKKHLEVHAPSPASTPKTFDEATLALLDACEALAAEYDRTVRAHTSGGPAGVLAVGHNRIAQRLADLIPATAQVFDHAPTLPHFLSAQDLEVVASMRRPIHEAALRQVVSAVAFGVEMHLRPGGTVEELEMTAATLNCWALEAMRQAVGVWVVLPFAIGSNPLSSPLAGHRYSELLRVVERVYGTCTSMAQEAQKQG